MRLVLLKPPNFKKRVTYPLGLMYLASYTRSKRPADEITILLAEYENLDMHALRTRLQGLAPDVVGISGLFLESKQILDCAAVAQEIGAKVIVGGPATFSVAQVLVADPNVDAICVGEGEQTFVEFLDAVENNRSLNGIDGLQYRMADGGISKITPRALIENLDTIPLPAWDLIDVPGLQKRNASLTWAPIKKKPLPILSTRGCPYRCVYCHQTFGKIIRARSLDNLFAELEMLKKEYNLREIELADDIFNFDRERTKQFCLRLIESGLDLTFQFPSGLRADLLDEETVDLLVKAGMVRANYAIETVTPRLQKKVGKNLKLSQAMKIIEYTSQYDVLMGGYFMVGLEDETYAEAEATVDYAVNSKLHVASFFIQTIHPGTELFDKAVAAGKVSADLPPAEYISLNYGIPSTNLSQIPDDDLIRLRRKALRRFYFKWRRVYTIFRFTGPVYFFRRGFEALKIILTGKGFFD